MSRAQGPGYGSFSPGSTPQGSPFDVAPVSVAEDPTPRAVARADIGDHAGLQGLRTSPFIRGCINLKVSAGLADADEAGAAARKEGCSTPPSVPSKSRTLRRVSNSAVISTGSPRTGPPASSHVVRGPFAQVDTIGLHGSHNGANRQAGRGADGVGGRRGGEREGRGIGPSAARASRRCESRSR